MWTHGCLNFVRIAERHWSHGGRGSGGRWCRRRTRCWRPRPAWRSEGAALRANQQARERIGFQRVIVNTLLAFADRLAGGKLLPNALDRIRSGNINLAAGWSH
jgi:hypothetical protein